MKQFFTPIFAVTALLPVVLGHPVSTDTCDNLGWDSTTEGYAYIRKGTYQDCSAACEKDSKKCKSFSFGNINECNLYDVPLAGNFVKDRYSPYHFFDYTCIATWWTTTTTTTTSKTTSTKPVATTTTKAVTTTTVSKAPTTTSIKVPTSTSSKSTTTTTTASSKVSSSTTVTVTKSTTTTTSKSSTTTSVTTTSASSTSKTPSCPVPTWVVSNFVFFNSSHNLDCAGSDFDNELCYTGKPPQPAGYGPPDSVDATITDIGNCHQQNPGTTPRRSIGDNVVRCSGSSYQFAFNGNSNSASSTGHFDIQNPFTCPDGSGWYASGSIDFKMSCTYDSGKNATCTPASGTVSVPATNWGCSYGC